MLVLVIEVVLVVSLTKVSYYFDCTQGEITICFTKALLCDFPPSKCQTLLKLLDSCAVVTWTCA